MIRTIQAIAFSLCIYGQALGQEDDIDKRLKGLFFQLDINACRFKIADEVRTRLHREFADVTSLDTFRFRDTFFMMARDPYPSFKLRDLSPVPYDCDSVILFMQPAFVWQGGPAHAVSYRIKPRQLYGHLLSLHFYFSDSLTAESSYGHFKDSLQSILKRPVNSGSYTGQDGTVRGSSATFNIDELHRKHNYQRSLELSINYYPQLYELKLEFQKLTLKKEKWMR